MKNIVVFAVLAIVCVTARIGAGAGLPSAASGGDNAAAECLADLKLKLSANPVAVTLGQSIVLRWSATLPKGCGIVHFQLNRKAVAPRGSQKVTPMEDTTFTLAAIVSRKGQSDRKTAIARVTVISPMRVVIDRNAVAPTNTFAALVRSAHPA